MFLEGSYYDRISFFRSFKAYILAFVPILICHIADKHSTELRFTMAVLKHLF